MVVDLVFAPKVPSVGSHGREPVVKWPPPFSAFAASACGRRKCGVEGFAAGGILVAACKVSVSLSAGVRREQRSYQPHPYPSRSDFTELAESHRGLNSQWEHEREEKGFAD